MTLKRQLDNLSRALQKENRRLKEQIQQEANMPELTDFEVKVLRSVNGEDVGEIQRGAAKNKAMESLKLKGYQIRHILL